MENLIENKLQTKEQAEELDQRIKLYANMAWTNLMESAKCLKQMRDTKLYEQLGYLSFEDYSVKSLGIKERQAYTYISAYENLGERFLQLNANIGITKLSLLAQVPPTDRQEIVDSNDIAGMTVEEVKKLVAENNAKGEQISLLETELEKAKSELEEKETEADSTAAEEKESGYLERIAELEEELRTERSKPTEIAVREPSAEELEQLKKEVFEKAKTEALTEFAEEKKRFKEDKKKAAEKAKAAAEKELSEYKQRIEQLDGAAAEAVKKAEELEKQLAVAASPQTVQFSFYFEALQTDYQKILSSIKALKEGGNESGEKFKSAMLKYLEIMKQGISDI